MENYLRTGNVVWSEVSFNNSGMNREVHVPLCERLAGRLRRPTRLFNDNDKGAAASAVIYSLVMTCKVNEIDPYIYLKHIIEKLPYCENQEDYLKLTPQNYKLSL